MVTPPPPLLPTCPAAAPSAPAAPPPPLSPNCSHAPYGAGLTRRSAL